MSETSRKFLIRLFLILAAGTLIGWLYGRLQTGLLAAALAALAFQVQRLLAFDRALATRDFRAFRHGEGIWQRIYSRLAFERERGTRYKSEYRRLLKEVRKSTNALPDGAVILDAGNEIVACNRAAGRLAGLKRKKDRGQRVDNIVRNPRISQLLHAVDGTISVDIPSPVTDGEWLNCRVVPYGADQKLLLMRDVTERVALTRMRRDFLANASHELRSPLTVISGYLETLADEESLPPELEKPLREMRSQARRMTRLIDELLELSRLEAAGKAGTNELVDVASLLSECRSAYSAQPECPTIEIDAEATAALRGNAGEVESVIRNLLSNAIRHTSADGTVTLTWRAAAGGADLSVRDTGEGIAEKHLPRLTERFYRVDRGRAREDGGVGLGLAIVKHVLNRHDAELGVSSTPGAGSEFRCHFPASRVEIRTPSPVTGVAEES